MEVIRSDVFARYEKEFAQRIISGLSNGYLQKLYETQLVQTLQDVVNHVHDLSMKDPLSSFELSTSSIFIHGNKSQVTFDYYGENKPGELGDLIFIISLVLNRQIYFEKLTVNQFKRDKTGQKSIAWEIDHKQLYLLSRFPKFRVVKGLIPKKEFSLPNYSGCLGSFGLLYRPGDFVFVRSLDEQEILV
jgi:hypothetical protein